MMHQTRNTYAASALLAGTLLMGAAGHAANVPIVNGDFTNGFNGWTDNYNLDNDPWHVGTVVNPPGLLYSHYAIFHCIVNCENRSNGFGSLSQNLNGLIQGEKYELSFYAMAFWNAVDANSLDPAGPIHLSLGNSLSQDVVPYFTTDISALPIAPQKVTLDFTYTDSASSALFTALVPLGSGLPQCAPCIDYMSGFVLADLGPGVLPPPPTVSEPSTLGLLGVALGAVGWVSRARRRDRKQP